MSKIIFFLKVLFAPVFLFLILNCIVFIHQIKNLKNDSSILVQLPVVFSMIGIGVFIYYICKSIKNKVFIINMSNDKISFIFNYASILTVVSTLPSIFIQAESILTVFTFVAGNFTNLFIILYFFNVSKLYENEFVDEFKLVYADSKSVKWFLLFSKSMFNLNVKFNNDGVMVNDSFIAKESIKYYEEMFDKRLKNLSRDELKLIEMNAI
jgi:hypothetical protein